MSLSQLLAHVRPGLDTLNAAAQPAPFPAYILFLSACSGQERAYTAYACGSTLEEAWQCAVDDLQRWEQQQSAPLIWLRADVVDKIQTLRWDALQEKLEKTKRNYFRFGLSFTPDFQRPILEQEINANALLYHSKEGIATPNTPNLSHFSRWRFGCELRWPENPEQLIWRFTTRSVFCDGEQVYPIESKGRNSGYRQLHHWQEETLDPMIVSATDYLARQVKNSGRYHYGWFPCFDRAIPTYNALRHASSTYALLEGWEVTQEPAHFAAIERALGDLSNELIETRRLPDGSDADFLIDTGGEIKLGGNAVCILAMAKYTELTGDQRYLPQMQRLANGIGFMQKTDTGGFNHVLNAADLSLKAEHRIIYYDGEAAFALMRLYGLTKTPRWLEIVERAMDHFIAQKHWQAHDHWLSYCVNELTLYRPLERYYQFGLDNVRDHLDFVINRVTTYPTLLELMMAASRMLSRLATSEHRHLLDGFDLEKFNLALETRARYLANGFFWPELAMFFKNPPRIVGSFFIRHHSFRVRIDDVEHYLSGYVAYRKHWRHQHDKTT
ncbi:glycoside hydrolase family 88 protein [Kluyvera georgiana]|uniref:Mur ligase n=1 Tax=Kluyvera georgiana TaxID=73098 RepID=UPI003AF186B0